MIPALLLILPLLPVTNQNAILTRESASKPLVVRVETIRGAPRILVNGIPKRGRFFYGQPASGTIDTVTDWKLVKFSFKPQQDTITGTMHFRFGQKPGSVDLESIKIYESGNPDNPIVYSLFSAGITPFKADWNTWPPVPQNTVGTVTAVTNGSDNHTGYLHVEVQAPPNGTWPDFHMYHNANIHLIKGREYTVSMWIRSSSRRAITVAFYEPGTTYAFLGGPPGHYESEVKLAARAGVNFVSFSVPMPWPGPGEKEDWSGVDSVCETTLEANPAALMLPRIPVYAPHWWLDAHPNDCMKWEDGDHGGIASPASDTFRRDASVRLERLIRHIEEKYGSHIAGYHPNGQNTGEWFYFDSWNHPLNGYSSCDTVAYRAWLRNTYGSPAALASAWRVPGVDFDSAQVPSAARRHASPSGVFRSLESERDIIDFSRFQQDSMADLVCSLAHVVRAASEGRKLVAFFYGYVYEFGAIPTGPASSGHYALRKLLTCPDIDIVCSPISYYDRGPGQSAPCMSAAESVALAGKLWLNEDDTRTYLTTEDSFPGAEHVVLTLEATNRELVRNVAQESLRNFATWWMDLPATGWFDDPGMWAEMARLNRLDTANIEHPHAFKPEVADVIDTSSMLLIAEGGDAATRPLLYESRSAFGKLGTPYGQYLSEDVINGKVHAKLYVFPDAFQMTATTREKLLAATRGAVSLYCYAPGHFDGWRESMDSMRDITGFRFTALSDVAPVAAPTPLGLSLGLTHALTAAPKVHPLYACADAKPDEILATYPDGSAAIALRRRNGGTTIFCGVPGLSSEMLRTAARLAKVHLYTQQDCCVYANGPFLALHAVSDGPISVNTGSSGKVVDMMSGEQIGIGPALTLTMSKSQTIVLQTRQEP